MAVSDASEWLSRVERVSVFAPESLPGGNSVWKALTGEDPEIDENRPREGIRREAGPYLSGFLDVQSQPGRIDVSLLPVATQYGLPRSAIGPAAEISRPFLASVSQWLGNSELNFMRIAYAPSRVRPVSSVLEGYKLLAGMLKSVNVDPERMRDFSYQVNWRTPAVHGVEFLNRMTTFQVVTISTISTVNAVTTGANVVRSEFFVNLEMDINTPAEQVGPLEKSSIVPILAHLAELAQQNCAEGEVP